MFEQFIEGLVIAFEIPNLLASLGGVVFGVFIGVLPGLNATTGMVILLPLTFGMETIPAILMLCGIYVGGEFGGAIPAILLKIPGTSPACATVYDGYELTKKGRGGAAIGMAVIASTMGGLIGLTILILIAQPLANIALKFGPAEYFALGIFGLSIITSLSGKAISKGIIALCIGFFISTIGIDQFVGFPRFIFGRFELMSGVPMLPVFIGFFAASEAFIQSEIPMSESPDIVTQSAQSMKEMFPTIKELKQSIRPIIHGGLLGTFIGVLPGAGATIAAFLGYDEVKRWSKNSDSYGTGIMEGVAAPEAANNGAVGGALVPMLTLGIPGSGSTAVMLAALMIHGLTPGPLLFQENPDLIRGIYGGQFYADIFLFLLGIFVARYFVKLLKLPKPVLSVLVLTFCVVGAYSAENNIFNIVLMLTFGFVGYLLIKMKYPITPLVLGYVLGPIIEENLRRALTVFGGDVTQLFLRPISGILLILAIITLVAPLARSVIKGSSK